MFEELCVLDNFLVAASILKEGSVVALTGDYLHSKAPTVEDYCSDPLKYWREYLTYTKALKARSVAQDYVCRLQKLGILREIITNDITGTYQAAGCKNVIELYERYDTGACLVCGTKSSLSNQPTDKTPICENCEGLIIPAIYFSPDKEALDQAVRAVSNCNALLLLNVADSKSYPFSLLIWTAKRCGSKIIGVGFQSNDLMDVFLNGDPQLIFRKMLEIT